MIAAEKAGCHGWLPDLRQGQAELVVYRVRLNTFTTVADKSIARALTTKKMAHAFEILHIKLHRNCISRCIYILIIGNE